MFARDRALLLQHSSSTLASRQVGRNQARLVRLWLKRPRAPKRLVEHSTVLKLLKVGVYCIVGRLAQAIQTQVRKE